MDDRSLFRLVRNWVIGFIITIMLLFAVSAVVSRAFDLMWYPWEIKQRTGMIRNSNSYITTQQTALRRFRKYVT